MNGTGYLHATEVLDQLSGDQSVFQNCLLALKNGEEGRRLLAAGDSSGAIVASRKAESAFARIPQARFLLGICKADLAAANGNIGNWQEAARLAREAIEISEKGPRFRFTQAAANMTLGNALYSSGQPVDGARHLDEARRLFRSLPGGAQYIGGVDHNERQFRQGGSGSAKQWWQFWK